MDSLRVEVEGNSSERITDPSIIEKAWDHLITTPALKTSLISRALHSMFSTPKRIVGLLAPQMVEILVVSSSVVILGTVAFACCVAAEFHKLKVTDIELDGSLCYLPTSSAFGLGIAAIVCIFIAQVLGTTMSAIRLSSGCKDSRRSREDNIVPITLLILSWVSFGLTTILLATGSSMNRGQPYGKGWLGGECYLVNTGTYVGAAALTVATVAFILGFIFSTRTTAHQRTSPDMERKDHGGK